MAAKVQLLVEGSLSPRNRSEVKKLAQELIDVVRAKDPGNLGYEWYLNDDETRYYLLESYRDSASLTAHLVNVGHILPRLRAVSKTERLQVFGEADPEAKKMLGGVGATFFAYWNGLTH